MFGNCIGFIKLLIELLPAGALVIILTAILVIAMTFIPIS